jgi:hypothetical protein
MRLVSQTFPSRLAVTRAISAGGLFDGQGAANNISLRNGPGFIACMNDL